MERKLPVRESSLVAVAGHSKNRPEYGGLALKETPSPKMSERVLDGPNGSCCMA
jgi:hypothetical protein